MPLRINNIVLGIDEDISAVKEKAAKKLRLHERDLKEFKILRESIDARRKDTIKFNYTVEVQCDGEKKLLSRIKDKDVRLEEAKYNGDIVLGNKKAEHRPVIIGMGPAGLFAGLVMAKKGYAPLIFERGEDVDARTKTVDEFWKSGILNISSNVQFGEGGAGAFSDGKLTTRIKDYRCDFILEELVRAGAPEEIIYTGKPHVGTDVLKTVVKNIRQEIIKLGGEVRFNSTLEDIIIKNGALTGIVVKGDTIPCEYLLMAIGHSSRDTYEMLNNRGVSMEAKPFAIGVRAEHKQRFIDEKQYGKFAGHKRLKAADYRLAYTSERTGRAVYSFCMCPGGEVVAAASEDGRLVTNGMSYHARAGENANAAIVVSVSPEDFEGTSPLSGMEFQRHYEREAFLLGGKNYYAPIQLLGDFMNDRVSKSIGRISPSYTPGYEFKDLRKCLPHYVIETLKDGFVEFDKKINGFADNDVILTGIETRTSAPLRIERNEKLQSKSVSGIYPAGEGAGYAGGIVSAAVDGIKCAESIMSEIAPLY